MCKLKSLVLCLISVISLLSSCSAPPQRFSGDYVDSLENPSVILNVSSNGDFTHIVKDVSLPSEGGDRVIHACTGYSMIERRKSIITKIVIISDNPSKIKEVYRVKILDDNRISLNDSIILLRKRRT